MPKLPDTTVDIYVSGSTVNEKGDVVTLYREMVNQPFREQFMNQAIMRKQFNRSRKQ